MRSQTGRGLTRAFLGRIRRRRPGCGPLLSWVPFSVLRGIKRNNPDVDKEILVQLHNVSSLVVRTFPLLPRAESATMEVGVDHRQLPVPIRRRRTDVSYRNIPSSLHRRLDAPRLVRLLRMCVVE